MTVGVLCAVQGSAESIIVQAVEQTGGRLSVTRRCADLTELLAAAEAGLGRLAVVSGDLELLDREAIDLLHRAGVRVVGIGDAARPWLGERLTALGADLVAVAPQDEAAAGSVVRDALAILGSARDDEAPEPRWPRGDRRPAAQPGPRRRRLGPTGAPGRTTVAVNVAAELAAAGRRTLLVDADTYGGCVAQVVGMLDEAPGLAAAARAAGAGHARPDHPRAADAVDRARPAGAVRDLAGGPVAGAAVVVARRGVVGGPRARGVDGGRLRLLPGAGRGAQLRHPGARAATPPRSARWRRRTSSSWSAPVTRWASSGWSAVSVSSPTSVSAPRGSCWSTGCAPPWRARTPGTPSRRPSARYAGVTDAHLVPDDRAAVDTALLEARTLREARRARPCGGALAGVAARVDAAAVGRARLEPVAAARA